MKFKLKYYVPIWSTEDVFNRGVNGTQRASKADLHAMAAAFNARGKALLVDEEHFSRFTTKSSTALAWITEMVVGHNAEANRDMLYAKMEPTPDGLAKIESGALRFCSAVLDLDPTTEKDAQGRDVFRPVKVISVGLTNVPNHEGLPPISEPVEPSPAFNTNKPGGDDPPPNQENQSQNQTKPMNEIAKALGLPDDATQEQITAKIAELISRAEAAESAAVDAAMNAAKDVIPAGKEQTYRSLCAANREAFDSVVADLRSAKPAPEPNKPATKPQPVFNRIEADAGRSPGTPAPQDRTPAQHLAAFNTMKAGKERSAYFNAHREDILQAQTAAGFN